MQYHWLSWLASMKPVGTFIIYSHEDVLVGDILDGAPVVARYDLGGGVFEYQINYSRADCMAGVPPKGESTAKKWWRWSRLDRYRRSRKLEPAAERETPSEVKGGKVPETLKGLASEVEQSIQLFDGHGYRLARAALTGAVHRRGQLSADASYNDRAASAQTEIRMSGLDVARGGICVNPFSPPDDRWPGKPSKASKRSFDGPIFSDRFWVNARSYREALSDCCPHHPRFLEAREERRRNAQRIKDELKNPEHPVTLASDQRQLVEKWISDARKSAWTQSKRSPGNYKFHHGGRNRGPEDEIGGAYLALVQGVAEGTFEAGSTADFVRRGVGWRVVDVARSENELRSKETACDYCGGIGTAYPKRRHTADRRSENLLSRGSRLRQAWFPRFPAALVP
jgi:hypothetical protein